jgi:hypothetical protein
MDVKSTLLNDNLEEEVNMENHLYLFLIKKNKRYFIITITL